MPDITTHVLDGARGGPIEGVVVEVHDVGGQLLATATTDDRGRIEALGESLPCGSYRITWHLAGFVEELSATFSLDADRRYHVPLLVSGHSAVVYLGA